MASDSKTLTQLDRRTFLVTGTGGCMYVTAAGGLLGGCKTTTDGTTAKALDAAVGPGIGGASSAAISDFLAKFGAIHTVTEPATGFLGDEPIQGHPVLRDKVVQLAPASGAPDEVFDVVVVGGGMSGLSVAYRIMVDAQASGLTDFKICVLEQASRFGGNAKGESWNGIDYSIGAAYMVQANPGDVLFDNFYGPLAMDKMWRESTLEDPVELGGKVFRGFWDGITLDQTDTVAVDLFVRVKNFFVDLANGPNFPNIPPLPGQEDDDWARILALDTESTLEYMNRRFPYQDTGQMHPLMGTLIEHYCWSSFGGSAAEISAAAGLNFLAGEFIGIAQLPGGNSQANVQLLRGLLEGGVLPANLRTNQLVVQVTDTSDGVEVTVAPARPTAGQAPQPGPLPTSRLKAKMVVMACPKFIAAHLCPQMPQSHRDVILTMTWRSYLVANALYAKPFSLNGKPAADFLDLYLLGNGKTVTSANPSSDAPGAATDPYLNEVARIRATDLLQSHWAQLDPRGTSPLTLTPDTIKGSVFTFYRGYPYDGARKQLIPYQAGAVPTGVAYDAQDKTLWNQHRTEFQTQIVDVMTTVFNIPDQPVEVRVSRWGHPLPLARKGFYNRDNLNLFQNGFSGRILYCHQDNWALPAIETCLSEALTMAAKVKAKLHF